MLSAANATDCRQQEAEEMQQKQPLTILYSRLSRDDENSGTSESIVNQEKFLRDYAAKNNFPNPVCISEACDIIEPNPRSLATSGFREIWFILYYA
jgi:hypothetical protein